MCRKYQLRDSVKHKLEGKKRENLAH